MSGLVPERAAVFAFKIDSGRPWYLLFRRAMESTGGGAWETLLALPQTGESTARAAVRTVLDVATLQTTALWALDHAEVEYDPADELVRFVPSFAALVAGEAQHGATHDVCRWFSATEAANALVLPARRAALESVHQTIGQVVARGGETPTRLRIR